MKKLTLALAISAGFIGGGVYGTAYGKEVTATGFSCDFEQALEYAKTDAVAQVTGTYVNSERTLHDQQFSSKIVEYNSGFVKHLNVNSFTDCKLEITAEVDTVKDNEVDFNKSFPAPEVADVEKIQLAMYDLDNPSKALATSIDDVKYTVEGKFTKVTVSATTRINPKWYSDLKTLAHTIDRKKTPEDRFAEDIIGMIAYKLFQSDPFASVAITESTLETTEPYDDTQVVCFARTVGRNTHDCYETIYEFQRFPARIPMEIWAVDANNNILSQKSFHMKSEVFYDKIYQGDKTAYRKHMNPGIAFFEEGKQEIVIQFHIPTNELKKIDEFRIVSL